MSSTNDPLASLSHPSPSDRNEQGTKFCPADLAYAGTQVRNRGLANALGGLLGALVSGAVQARSQTPPTQQPSALVLGSISESETPTRSQPAPRMDEVLGSLLGGGTLGTQPRGGEDALGSLLASLLGGGAPSTQPSARDDVLGSLLGSLMGGGAPSAQPSTSGDALGSLLSSLLEGGTSVPSQRGYPSQSMPSSDPVGTLLSSLLGVDTHGGAGTIANNPIANAFVAPIAEALARKTGIPLGIAQVVVVFAINTLLSGLTQPGTRRKFQREELIEKLQSGEPITQSYLKESGLLPALVEETGLNQKAAAQSLQLAFQALSTQMGEGTFEEHQQELQTFLRKWK